MSTGGAGLVGSHLSERLLRHGWEVHAPEHTTNVALETCRQWLGESRGTGSISPADSTHASSTCSSIGSQMRERPQSVLYGGGGEHLRGRKAVNKVGQKFMGRRLVRPLETGNWWCPSAARRKIVDSFAGNGSLSYETMRSAPLFDRAKLDALLQEARAREEFADTGLFGRIVAAELSLRAVDATLGAA